MTRLLADASPTYRRFKTDRDRALERILHNARLKQSDILRTQYLDPLTRSIPHALAVGFTDPVESLRRVTKACENQASVRLAGVADRLKRSAFTLSYIGEAEALALARGTKTEYQLTNQDAQALALEPSLAGGRWLQRIQLYLGRISAKVLDAVQTGIVNQEPVSKIMMRVNAALPEEKSYVAPPPQLRRVKAQEADIPLKRGDKADLSVGFVDDVIWQAAVDDYLNEYVPLPRDPNTLIRTPGARPGEPEAEKVYTWEFERDLTEEFVKQVRDGEVDAAKENGVTDFVHIAVIDDRTDECCRWRDGLLLSEIERELKGSHSDDSCQGFIPPLHFNCRCRIAPVLDSISEQRPDVAKEFDEWLKS